VLVSYLIRLAIEKSGEEYLSFPQRALFDKLGIRTMRIETDPFGNFLGQGYEVGSGRDWARLGNLYLQDGVWNGERILPPGYVRFVSTPASAWVADKRVWLGMTAENQTRILISVGGICKLYPRQSSSSLTNRHSGHCGCRNTHLYRTG
jgi:CubicO group peptidase (beta-lactamase class C family)